MDNLLDLKLLSKKNRKEIPLNVPQWEKSSATDMSLDLAALFFSLLGVMKIIFRKINQKSKSVRNSWRKSFNWYWPGILIGASPVKITCFIRKTCNHDSINIVISIDRNYVFSYSFTTLCTPLFIEKCTPSEGIKSRKSLSKRPHVLLTSRICMHFKYIWHNISPKHSFTIVILQH